MCGIPRPASGFEGGKRGFYALSKGIAVYNQSTDRYSKAKHVSTRNWVTFHSQTTRLSLGSKAPWASMVMVIERFSSMARSSALFLFRRYAATSGGT